MNADSDDLSDLIEDVSRSFGIGIEALAHATTFGAVHDALVAHFVGRFHSGVSLPAASYYAISRTTRNVTGRRTVRPSMRIVDIAQEAALPVRDFWSLLQAETGLRLPKLCLSLSARWPWLAVKPSYCCETVGGVALMALALNFEHFVATRQSLRPHDIWLAMESLSNEYFGPFDAKLGQSTAFR